MMRGRLDWRSGLVHVVTSEGPFLLDCLDVIQSNLQCEVGSDDEGVFSFANWLCFRGRNQLGRNDEPKMLLVFVGVGFGWVQTHHNSNVLAVISIQTHHCHWSTHDSSEGIEEVDARLDVTIVS